MIKKLIFCFILVFFTENIVYAMEDKQETSEEEEIKRSWRVARSSMLLERFGKGEIILLYGTSSSGKSTTCKKIRKLYPEWRIDSLDQGATLFIEKTIKELFPNEKDIILEAFIPGGLCSIVFFEEGTFRENVQKDKQVKALEACARIKQNKHLIFKRWNTKTVEEEIFEGAFQASIVGQSTVIDTVDFLQFVYYKEQNFFNCPVRYVLTYCPLSKLHERISQRNKTSRLREKRYGTHPFSQFGELFKSVKADENRGIERIYRQNLLESFHLTFEDYIKHLPEKNTHETYKAYLQDKVELLKNLDLESTSSVEIEPRFYYDYILHTYKHPPKKCAELTIRGCTK